MSSEDKEELPNSDRERSTQESCERIECCAEGFTKDEEKCSLSCDQPTELSDTCTAVPKEDDQFQEEDLRLLNSGSTDYIDLKSSKSDKLSIEADDSAEKISIQATDSDNSQQMEEKVTSGHTCVLNDVCRPSRTISDTVEDDEDLKNKIKKSIICNDNDMSKDNSDDIVCGATKATGDSKEFVQASETCPSNDDCEEEEDSEEEEENYESAEEGDADEEELKLLEEKMTPEEKEEKKKEALVYKEEGNRLFKDGRYKEAISRYTRALWQCPLSFPKDRSIMFSNRAACKFRLEKNDDAIKDCTKAIDLHPHYLRPLLRRAELYEKVEKLEEALVDYQKAVELDPSQHGARAACMRLPEQIKERNEKMKAEMLGKLKDLGNMILRPFGLSTNNFEMKQDPNSGGYSVNFKPSSPTDN